MGVRERWQRIGVALAGVGVLGALSQLVVPGVNASVVREALRNSSNPLLVLYDRIAGGGLSGAGVFALGIVPYLSARIFIRLARWVSPALERRFSADGGQRALVWSTRALTIGLSLVQSYGFAHFLQSLPGAVSDPGLGFVLRTMGLLTSGAAGVMLATEHVNALVSAESEVPEGAGDPVLAASVQGVLARPPATVTAGTATATASRGARGGLAERAENSTL